MTCVGRVRRSSGIFNVRRTRPSGVMAVNHGPRTPKAIAAAAFLWLPTPKRTIRGGWKWGSVGAWFRGNPPDLGRVRDLGRVEPRGTGDRTTDPDPRS